MTGKAYLNPSTSNTHDDEAIANHSISKVERIDLLRLARLARYCDYTCTFCFKAFPSAQALGGHQNAHKTERMEEKRLYVRDPIAYRRRIFLQSSSANRHMKSTAQNGVHHHKYHYIDRGESSTSSIAAAASAMAAAGYVNKLYHPYDYHLKFSSEINDQKRNNFALDLNRFPEREKVHNYAGLRGGKACMEMVTNEAVMLAYKSNAVAFNGVKDNNGNGMIKSEMLDLTLKL